jgi:hypothetical protein
MRIKDDGINLLRAIRAGHAEPVLTAGRRACLTRQLTAEGYLENGKLTSKAIKLADRLGPLTPATPAKPKYEPINVYRFQKPVLVAPVEPDPDPVDGETDGDLSDESGE